MANIETKKDKTLGQRITELLDKKGILQRELAERVGITETTMSRYINDKREPKGTVLSKIAEVLGVSSDYLAGNTEAIEGERIPQELRDLGVSYIEVAKKAKSYEITAEELDELIETIKKMKSKK